MEKIHRDILKQNAVLLTREMEISDEFLAVLSANRVISDANREELLLPGKTSQKRSSEFQLMIPRKGPKAFSAMMQALVATNQIHIADKLDPHLSARFQAEYGTDPHSPHMQETTPPIGTQKPSFFDNPPNPNNENSPFMTINIQRVTPQHLKRHNTDVDRGLAYDVKHTPRGNFIVINNEYFAQKSDRVGSIYDVVNLCELAKQLEFKDVMKSNGLEYKNLKGEQIKNELHALSKQDYSDHDALIISIMSHGANGVVYGVDGVPVDIESDICAPFDGQQCPTLSGKPKIFIIQACQGEEAVTGVPQADGPEDEGDARRDTDNITVAFRNLRLGDTTGSMPIKINQKIPHKSDMIIAYSTVRGYKSWRRPDLGSWFIRAIVTVFSQHAHEQDLQSLFTMVKNKVSQEKTSYCAGDEYIQMPRTDDTLRKKWFFLPGYRENLTTSHA